MHRAALLSLRPYWLLQVRDMQDGSARWIAKPSITNQATGICIFDRVSQLEAALHANEDLREWVLQRWAYCGLFQCLGRKYCTIVSNRWDLTCSPIGPYLAQGRMQRSSKATSA